MFSIQASPLTRATLATIRRPFPAQQIGSPAEANRRRVKSHHPRELSSRPIDRQQCQQDAAPARIGPEADAFLDRPWLREQRDLLDDFFEVLGASESAVGDAGDLAEDFEIDRLALLLALRLRDDEVSLQLAAILVGGDGDAAGPAVLRQEAGFENAPAAFDRREASGVRPVDWRLGGRSPAVRRKRRASARSPNAGARVEAASPGRQDGCKAGKPITPDGRYDYGTNGVTRR